MKDKIVKSLRIIALLILGYLILDYGYYCLYDGDDEIHFLKFEGDSKYDYNDVFELPELKNKYVYVTLNNRKDYDNHQEDLIKMDSLYKRLNNDSIAFLYTVEDLTGFENKYKWKKTIKKYNLNGYHINLPHGYEWNLQETGYVDSVHSTIFPKYMMISKNGEIINKWMTRPGNLNKLINEIDSLIK